MYDMDYKKKLFLVQITLSLFALTTLLSLVACTCIPEMMSDNHLLIINNRTDEALSIYTREYLPFMNEPTYVWDIAPGEENRELWIVKDFDLSIVAKNNQGATVFSHEITLEKLKSSGLRRDNHYVYVIDIMVPQKVSEISDNTTTK